MLVVLWILNGILALVFLAAGSMKVARSREALLGQGMGYVEDFSPGAVKAIGAVEILGAIGLILPLLTNIAPILTPIAAVGLATTMVVATVVHIRRRESVVTTVVLAAVSIASAVIGFFVVLG